MPDHTHDRRTTGTPVSAAAAPDAIGLTTATGTGAGAGDVDAVFDLALAGALSLDGEHLAQRLALLGRWESKLHAAKATSIAALAARDGEGKAADLLRDRLKQSRGHATRDVKVAGRLATMPTTATALANGEITAQAARLIVEAADKAPPEAPADENELLHAARREPGDVFRHTVQHHLQARERRSDDPDGRRRRQIAQRRCGISQKPDGMWNLYGTFDPVGGAEIHTALMAEFARLRHGEDPDNRRTAAQRLADALKHLVTGIGLTHNANTNNNARAGTSGGTSGATGHAGTPRDGTTGRSSGAANHNPRSDTTGRGINAVLVLVADYDILARELRNLRLWDDTTLNPADVARLAADARIVPSIWRNKTAPLWFGQGRRHASATQRLALQIRDKHCVGCKTRVHGCEPHHIVFWEQGGKTDIDNLCLLCRSCHKHHLHRLGATITRDDNGHYHLAKPNPRPDGAKKRRPAHPEPMAEPPPPADQRRTNKRRPAEPPPPADQRPTADPLNPDDVNPPLLR